MIKQRFLGLALSLALIATFGFMSTARAADNILEVSASVSSVASVTLDAELLNFGTGLTFMGGGTGFYDSCSNDDGGWAYIGDPANVTVTVASSELYDLNRNISGDPRFTTNLFVENEAYGGCTNHGDDRALASTNPLVANDHVATSGTNYVNVFSFDVNAGDDPGTFNGEATYTLSF